jgi:protein-S-isoprenylcysteine O-methyltransferase Ste14
VPSPVKSATVSLAFTLFGGPGVLLFFLPLWITQFRIPAGEPLWQRSLCFVLMAIGLVPLLESIWRFVVVGRGTLVPAVPTEHLVVSGFYAYVRNPMYLGVLTVIACETLLFRSRSMLDELILTWLGIELFVRLYEERRLRRTYPTEYALYCRHVSRWLPRLTAWHPPA